MFLVAARATYWHWRPDVRVESSSGPAGRLELPVGHRRFINGTVSEEELLAAVYQVLPRMSQRCVLKLLKQQRVCHTRQKYSRHIQPLDVTFDPCNSVAYLHGVKTLSKRAVQRRTLEDAWVRRTDSVSRLRSRRAFSCLLSLNVLLGGSISGRDADAAGFDCSQALPVFSGGTQAERSINQTSSQDTRLRRWAAKRCDLWQGQGAGLEQRYLE
ncbi:hypothetical protein Q8A67_008488 [Cirrhinus molitorella]|uniref:Uncharacterized protein n=1 Tax=Cirrhinus molitorella TaxID=172907 RepID=A0AA88PXG6_9TELE|nr:hypothetical protein Q8A67_008488 [Cirrhinus molitorella]